MPALADDTINSKMWTGVMSSQTTVSWQAPGRSDNAWTIAHRSLRISAVHLERLHSLPNGDASLEYRDAWVDPITTGSRAIASGSLHLARVATAATGLAVNAARDAKYVHVVVRVGEPPTDVVGLRATARNVSSAFGSSDCGFLRTTLDADGPVMVTFSATAITAIDPPPQATDTGPQRSRKARERVLQAFVSTTRSTSDEEPVLSVSFGWKGPGQDVFM
jgi:hypothetical protein